MVSFIRQDPAFKRAVIASVSAHIVLFVLVLISPHFPRVGRKRMVHYVNLVSLPGGGGGGRASGFTRPRAKTQEEIRKTQAPARESLRELTTPEKLESRTPPSLRHPVEKPKREKKIPAEKKAVIQKEETKTGPPQERASQEGTEGGAGSGVRLGLGSGKGGGIGLGSEFASQIGLSNFPYIYYLEILRDRISGNWIQSQVAPGISVEKPTTVFFKIYRNGQVSVVEVEESSGIRALDLSAVRAVQSAAPFPPLPSDYEGEYLGIHLIFWHTR
ncbi:MAG: TonB family protein [Candidatus Aminicenantales bacterium]